MALEADARFSTQENYSEFKSERNKMLWSARRLHAWILLTGIPLRAPMVIECDDWMKNALRDDLLESDAYKALQRSVSKTHKSTIHFYPSGLAISFTKK
ncbi:MAG: hypothetical protein AAB573_03160 [Patescibacteria group bacterium]